MKSVDVSRAYAGKMVVIGGIDFFVSRAENYDGNLFLVLRETINKDRTVTISSGEEESRAE